MKTDVNLTVLLKTNDNRVNEKDVLTVLLKTDVNLNVNLTDVNLTVLLKTDVNLTVLLKTDVNLCY